MGGTRGGTRRVTQREAAEILGVSVEAIRKCIKRGTLPSEKGEDGRRYVYLDTGPDEDQPKAEGETSVPSGPLVEDLRDQVRYLRDQLREERRANDENRRLLAAALERIPALEPPPSASPSTEPESPQESPEEPGP
jgi:excisionase family DNA binding protein